MNPSNAIAVRCTACGHTIREGVPGVRCGSCGAGVVVDESVLEAYPDDTNLGAVIGGKYGLIDVLGLGGFGCVYEAIQEPVGRHVALKLVHKRHLADDQLRQRFFREARVVAQLTDPSVVTLYDYGEEADRGLYMVFELVRGRTLHQVIKSGPQEAFWTAHIVLQVLAALEEAHAQGMVHRDIKPGNVMVVEDAQGRQRARLLDFGIAKVIARGDADSSLETREGLVLGTPRYMSPEQARGRGDVDARSDLYSLAVLAYAVLSGTNPFERSSLIETIMAHVQMPPPPLDADLGVPAAFEAVLMKALQKDPADRFQDAPEMAEAIHRAFDAGEASGDMPRPTPVGNALGAAVSGLATPTPRSALPTPRPFADPEAVALGDVTQGSASGGAGQSSQSGVLPRPAATSWPLMLGAALALMAVTAVVAVLGYQFLGPGHAVLVEPLGAPPPLSTPKPTGPVARAMASLESGQTDRAVAGLVEAFEALPDTDARASFYQRLADERQLAPLLRLPELQRFGPAAIRRSDDVRSDTTTPQNERMESEPVASPSDAPPPSEGDLMPEVKPAPEAPRAPGAVKKPPPPKAAPPPEPKKLKVPEF